MTLFKALGLYWWVRRSRVITASNFEPNARPAKGVAAGNLDLDFTAASSACYR